MFFSLAKNNSTLLKTLYQWQLKSLFAVHQSIPRGAHVPDEWYTAVLPRLVNATCWLRQISSDDLADQIYGRLVEEFEFEELARYVSQWTLLQATSEGVLNETLEFCYSVPHRGELSHRTI